MLAPIVLAAIAALGQAVVSMKMNDCEDWFLVDASGFQQVAYDGTNLCVLDLQGGLRCSNSISTPVDWTTVRGTHITRAPSPAISSHRPSIFVPSRKLD